jgi:hypothetical protein
MVYLDGPWGLDYSKSQTTISSFVIDNIPSTSITDDQYAIEETHPLLENGTWMCSNILPGELMMPVPIPL